MKFSSRAKSWFVVGGLSLILLFLVSAIATYFGNNPYSKNYLKVIPLPVAFVSGSPIRLADYYARQSLNKVLGANLSNSGILDKMILDKKAEIVAAAQGIKISDSELTQATNGLLSQFGTPDLQKTLGITKTEFQNNYVKPELYQEKLGTWLSSNKALNSAAYAKLEQAQKALDNGNSFEDTAKQYSDDSLNAKIGGDLGFVSRQDVLPEIYQAAANIKDPQPHLVNSRLGLHLIEVLGTDNSGPNDTVRYHIKEIFIKTIDLQSWLSQHAGTVIKLI